MTAAASSTASLRAEKLATGTLVCEAGGESDTCVPGAPASTDATAALDAALLRLDGLLETIGHETQFDAFSSPPPADLEVQAAVNLVEGRES